jgi:peroxiredoxin Q/BCP
MLEPRTRAPELTLPDQDGDPISLADLRGHWVILWWYPKASTPGCTTQGQGLRDWSADLAAADCVVLGASFDTPEDNKAFAEEQRFGFRLLSDVDHAAGARYEVTRAPGEEHAGFAKRIAYLIDPEGVIAKSYEVTDVAGFAGQVLADLGALRAG